VGDNAGFGAVGLLAVGLTTTSHAAIDSAMTRHINARRAMECEAFASVRLWPGREDLMLEPEPAKRLRTRGLKARPTHIRR
jgi:hypothetical protein